MNYKNIHHYKPFTRPLPLPTVYVIAGPTAVGKTGVAIQFAQRLGTAIISADSRQCYREMNIGTAKPTPEQLSAMKHYFINEFPVTTSLTAADYESLALKYLDEIFTTHQHAVVCGGTGLYIKALCEGLDAMPEVDEAIATAINEQYKIQGLLWLRQATAAEDPQFYAQGESENPARLLRALIFKKSTGKSILDFRTQTKKQRPFNIVKVGLELPREVLYAHINNRVDEMMAAGLLEEATQLYSLRHLKNLQTVGYAELFDYMDSKYTLPEAIEKIKQNTRHYAKRQMTWFKKDKEMRWVSADGPKLVARILALQ